MSGSTAGAPAVLVIDDDDAICHVVTDILQLEGIYTYEAYTGHEGLAMYQKHLAEIGVVLLDLQLPDIFGSEVYALLKELNPSAEIIIVTGKYNPHQHFSEAVEILTKPFSMVSLLAAVKRRLYELA